MVAESLRELGQYRPVVVNRGTLTGRPNEIAAGNHTVQAAESLGWSEVSVTWIDVDDKQLRKIALVDNRSNDVATYDDRLLLDLLLSLEDDLTATGFDQDDVDELLASMEDEEGGQGSGEGEEDEEDEEPDRSKLLALADIGWTEPRHETHRGDHWLLDGRHHLFVVDPHKGWRAFVDTLSAAPAEAVFAPYPNPYLLGTKLAREVPFILVQPKQPLAGHLLDKFESLFPEARIEKLP